jgi:hypothetical protein
MPFFKTLQDAMGWIEENYQKYLRNHSIAVILGAATSSDDRDLSANALVEQVKSIYQQVPAPDGFYND